jgi:hypothetical protein
MSNSNEEQPRRDYLGRIVIGFMMLAGILWFLVHIT